MSKEWGLTDIGIMATEYIGHSIWLGILAACVYVVFPSLRPSSKVNFGMGLITLVPLLAIVFTFVSFNWFAFTITLDLSDWFVISLILSWFVGTFFYLFSLVRNYRKIKEIRKLANPVDRIKQLPILRSCKLMSPILIGLRSPVIMIPAETVLRGGELLQSVIHHEYAHYLRRDLWFNLYQHIIEGISFYNPGVRWLCREIRKERELACDDLAVSLMGGQRFHYAAALLECQSMSAQSGLCLAFGNESTADRAARIAFGKGDSDQRPFSKTLGIFIILIVGFLGLSIVSLLRFDLDSREEGSKAIERKIFLPTPDYVTDSPGEVMWKDKVLEEREVPVFTSVLIVEKNGVAIDLGKESPRLFNEVPNSWIRENNLDYLDGALLNKDPDGDHFSNLEEYLENTDPNDSTSHPDLVNLVFYTGQKEEKLRLLFAANPDDKTIQLTVLPTQKYPFRENHFLRNGGKILDGRITVRKIGAKETVIYDLDTDSEVRLTKNVPKDLVKKFAGFKTRDGRGFLVLEGEVLKLSDKSRWTVESVSKDSVEISRSGVTKQLRLTP